MPHQSFPWRLTEWSALTYGAITLTGILLMAGLFARHLYVGRAKAGYDATVWQRVAFAGFLVALSPISFASGIILSKELFNTAIVSGITIGTVAGWVFKWMKGELKKCPDPYKWTDVLILLGTGFAAGAGVRTLLYLAGANRVPQTIAV